MATECERVEYLNSRWQGRNPSTLSALTMRGLKGLVPVGLGSLAILLTLGACPARQEAPAPSPRPMAPVVVRSYHLDVHVGERRLEEDWQEAAGGTPEESLSRHLDLLAERLASK